MSHSSLLPNLTTDELAQSIASSFAEPANLEKYLHCCRKYSTQLIRQAYATAHQVPASKIRKSRAA